MCARVEGSGSVRARPCASPALTSHWAPPPSSHSFPVCVAYYSVRSAASRAQNKGWRVDYALGANLQGAEVVQHSTWPKNDHVPFYVTLKQ